MGCHTWFHTPKEVSFDVVKAMVIGKMKEGISIFQNYIDNPLGMEYLEMYSAYPEWTIDYLIHYVEVSKRQLRMVENGYCEVAVMNKYSIYTNSDYVPDKGIFVDAGYHDVFRNGNGYPEDQLFSLDETLAFILNPQNNCLVWYSTEDVLIEFWNKHPNGMIDFG